MTCPLSDSETSRYRDFQIIAKVVKRCNRTLLVHIKSPSLKVESRRGRDCHVPVQIRTRLVRSRPDVTLGEVLSEYLYQDDAARGRLPRETWLGIDQTRFQ